MSRASGGVARPNDLPPGISRADYEKSISAPSAPSESSRNLKSKEAKRSNPSVVDMIHSISSEIDKTLRAIQKYNENKDNKEVRITQQIEALHELYTRLQLIPEEGMSIDFRKRITDMKVNIFTNIQNALDLVDDQSIQELPPAVMPFYSSKGANKYTREQLEVFVKASDLLFIYGQHKLVSFNDLSTIRQAEIQRFVTGFIDQFALDIIPPAEQESFRTEMLTFNTLCCDLLALIIGSDLRVPDSAQQEERLMCELLAETCINVITRVRPIGDSVVMIGEAMAMNPFDFAKKGVMGAVAGAAAATSYPALTSLAQGVGNAFAGLGSAAVDFSIQNPLFAYGTLYHLFNYINEKLEIRELHNNPDFVFRRLLTNLRASKDRVAFNDVFGEAPPEINPVVDSFEFAGLLSKSARYVAETFCGQVRSAVKMVKTTAELPQSTLKVCRGMAARGNSAVHGLANRMTATAGLARDRMFSDCHSVMEKLLDTSKYTSLKENPLVIEFVRRLGLFDTQNILTEEKVAMHEAAGFLTSGYVPPDTSDTQDGVIDGEPSPGRNSLDDETVPADALPGAVQGPHGELLESSDPPFANLAPPKAGNDVLTGKRLAVANAENAENAAKAAKTSGRTSKKKKSNKNKRQSRRKFRRSFSRKGRK